MPADPFAGIQAASWADGESGIVIPSARPVGNFTVAQVKGAYEATRRLLIAANLDEQILLGGAPTTFAGLLTKQQRDEFLAGHPVGARRQPVLVSHIGARWRCRLRADIGYLTA